AYLDEVQAPQCEAVPTATQPQPPTEQPIGPVNPKAWLRDELVERLKKKAIPLDISKIKLCKTLSERMHAAAETNKFLSPVGWKYIYNHASEWGLWPLENVKIS